MLIACSRTAVGCETSTSPDCTFDNDPGFFSLDTDSVWAADSMRAVPFSTFVQIEPGTEARSRLDALTQGAVPHGRLSGPSFCHAAAGHTGSEGVEAAHRDVPARAQPDAASRAN